MTNNEIIERNITLSFDLLREIVKNPALLKKIPNNSVIEFIGKDFSVVENNKTIKPDKYLKVNYQFEMV